ncbi:MAG: DUF3501 family protein, partial [Burkholderiales bacterium]
ERENDDKTASVHFLRFEFTEGMIQTLKGGADIAAGCDHPQYRAKLVEISPITREALIADFA